MAQQDAGPGVCPPPSPGEEEVRPEGTLAVETVPDGSEVAEIGGVVVEGRPPPLATAVPAKFAGKNDTDATGDNDESTVRVVRSFELPAGGAVTVDSSYAVAIDVVDSGVDLVAPGPARDIRVIHDVLRADEAGALLESLKGLPWRRERDCFGPVLRETFYCGDPGCAFVFCDLRLDPLPWPPALLAARTKVAAACGVLPTALTACLVNHYPENTGSIPFHRDEVRAHDPKLVASLSLGGPRAVRLRRASEAVLREEDKNDAEQPPPDLLFEEYLLEPGSLFLLSGADSHHFYEHELPLRDGVIEPYRISCTFRAIVPGAEDALRAAQPNAAGPP